MKRWIPVYVIIITLMLSACRASSGGPQTWLDSPLDNTTIPIGSLIIQAHASDSNGISTFEFYVNDTFLSSVSSNGERLGEASVEWTPEAGTYTIKARAANKQGEFGPTTSVHIIVVSGSDLATLTPTPASAMPECAIGELAAPVLLSPADNALVGSDPLLSWSYPGTTCHPHSYKIDISEEASFADISWGFGTLDHNETSRQWPLPTGVCYYWRASAYAPDTYGPVSTAWRFCIEATPTPAPLSLTETLIPSRTPTVTAQLIPSKTPTLKPPLIPSKTPTLTSSPIPDTTPPFFIGSTVSPENILTDGTGCSSYARTTNVQAHVVDSGGSISKVWAVWNVGAESGQINLSAMGGDYYQVLVGPVHTVGILNITIYAQDLADNSSQSGTLTVNVQNCIQ